MSHSAKSLTGNDIYFNNKIEEEFMSTFKIKHFASKMLFVLLGISFVFLSVKAISQTGTELVYKSNEGDILKYQSIRQTTRTSEREGEPFEFNTTRKYDFQLEAEQSDSLLSFVLTINDLDISSEGRRGGRFQSFDPENIKGKRIQIKISPKGEHRGLAAIDEIPMPERRGGREGDRRGEGRGNPLEQLRVNFFILPDRPLKVGDSWTEQYKDLASPGSFFGRFVQNQKVEGKTNYTVLGEEKKNGLSCLHIKIESTYSREAEGEMRGNKVTMEGEGETKAEAWFAPKEGILVELIHDDFFESTTAFSGRTMPSSNESKLTLKLLKWQPKQ